MYTDGSGVLSFLFSETFLSIHLLIFSNLSFFQILDQSPIALCPFDEYLIQMYAIPTINH